MQPLLVALGLNGLTVGSRFLTHRFTGIVEGLDLLTGKFLAFCAGFHAPFLGTRTNFALLAVGSHCFDWSLAASAFASRVHATGSTVQAAKGAQVLLPLISCPIARQGKGAAGAQGCIHKCAAIHYFGFHITFLGLVLRCLLILGVKPPIVTMNQEIFLSLFLSLEETVIVRLAHGSGEHGCRHLITGENFL